MPIGAGLQHNLGEKRLSQADQWITNVSAEKDFASDSTLARIMECALGLLHIRSPRNFGRKYSIPSAYTTPGEIHTFIMGSLAKHLGYDTRTLPSEMQVQTS